MSDIWNACLKEIHVLCLKKVIGDKIPVQIVLPKLDKEGKIIWDPEVIIETRIHQLRN